MKKVGETAAVFYEGRELQALVIFKDPAVVPAANPPWPWPDVALLDIEQDIGLPAVLDARLPEEGTRLRIFGFPHYGDEGGENPVVIYESQQFVRQISSDIRMVLRRSQIGRGMSGGPLYVPGETPVVVGLVTATNDDRREEGGLALPVLHVARALPDHVAISVRNLPTILGTGISPAQNFDESPSSDLLFPLSQAARTLRVATLAESRDVISLIERSERARRRGRPREALALATQAADHPFAAQCSASLRARTMRALAITIVEERGDLSRAKRLSDEAANLDTDPIAIARLDSMIAHAERGPEAALALLPAGSSPEIDAIRTGYLIELEEIQQADKSLSALPTSESEKPRVRRLLLLVAILLKRRNEAIRLAEGLVVAASQEAAIAFSVLQAFVLASEPVQFWPARLPSWPQPIPSQELVDDPEQTGRLEIAIDLSDGLLDNEELLEEDISLIEMWRFGALAFELGRRAEAIEVARKMLERQPPNYRVIPWVWAMPLNVNVEPALDVIRARADDNVAAAEEVLALASAALRDGDGVGAEVVLRRYESAFSDPLSRSKLLLFLMQALIVQHRHDEAAALVDGITAVDDRRSAERLLIESGEDRREAMEQLVERWRTTGDDIALLIAAEIAHQRSDWTFLADNGHVLV